MFTLKHLKTLQHVSILFRALIYSLLKLLILKFVKNVKVNVVMRQHNIGCVYVRSVWRCVSDCSPNVMLPHHHTDFYIFNKF